MCGYLAIILFVSILHEMNPESIHIDQTQLQRQVLKIFDTRVLEPFLTCDSSFDNNYLVQKPYKRKDL